MESIKAAPIRSLSVSTGSCGEIRAVPASGEKKKRSRHQSQFRRRRAATIPSDEASKRSPVGWRKSTLNLHKLLKGSKKNGVREGDLMTTRFVRFSNESPKVTFVRKDAEARTSRVGSWEVAPFHDEYWDGDKRTFRKDPITPHEVRQANLRHSILSFLSSTVRNMKTKLGLTEVPRAVEDESCYSTVVYSNFLKLVGPSA